MGRLGGSFGVGLLSPSAPANGNVSWSCPGLPTLGPKAPPPPALQVAIAGPQKATWTGGGLNIAHVGLKIGMSGASPQGQAPFGGLAAGIVTRLSLNIGPNPLAWGGNLALVPKAHAPTCPL